MFTLATRKSFGLLDKRGWPWKYGKISARSLHSVQTYYIWLWTLNTLAQLLYSVNVGNLAKDVDAIAESITKYIRQGPNSTTADGVVWISETFIKVHWPWLTYPAFLVLSRIGLLVLSITYSTRGSRIAWKSSSLALLFHGLHGWDRNDLQSRKTANMKEISANVWTQLKENDRGKLALLKRWLCIVANKMFTTAIDVESRTALSWKGTRETKNWTAWYNWKRILPQVIINWRR